MRKAGLRNWRAGAALAAVLWAGGTAAQESGPDPAQWQSVITGQIEAFRSGDDAAALSFAGRAFQYSFTDPAAFVSTIRGSGYGPIMDSTAHSFGVFDVVNAAFVLQIVEFSGADLQTWVALYQLGLEPEGWRVHGVKLRALPVLNI